ncbi:MAG: hypothetical protein IJU63_09045, partial [Bacteroidales bacterium]|nr:hypothetical protein [Bacteroidales bacterium]
MMYDVEMIRAFYEGLDERIKRVRSAAGRPLTLAEKVLYAHLYDPAAVPPERGAYADFRPDRVAMQDATA